MNDSRKTDTDVIRKLRFQLMLGEECMKVLSFRAVDQHIGMYKMFMRWAKESSHKLMIRNELFGHITPIELVTKIDNINLEVVKDTDEVKDLMENYGASSIQVKWLFAIVYINRIASEGRLGALFESWTNFVKVAKKLNRI